MCSQARGTFPTEPATILLVEDDVQAAQTLADVLAAHGYEVVLAATGQEALRQARTANAAIVDVRLPDDVSGLEVLRHLKEATPEIECLVVTGYADLESAIRSLNLGAFCYLRKPIDMSYLLESLKRALERQRLSQALRQRLREIEGAARLNAVVLNERVDLMEQLESERAQLATLSRWMLKACQATDAAGLLGDLVSLVECLDYGCLLPSDSSNGHGRRVEHCGNLDPFPREPNWDSLVAEIRVSGQGLFLDSPPDDAIIAPMLKAAGICSLAALPVRAGPGPSGVMVFCSRQHAAFRSKETFLGLLAGIYALAWQRLQTLQWCTTVLGTLSEGAVIADGEGRVVPADEAMSHLLGVPVGAVKAGPQRS